MRIPSYDDLTPSIPDVSPGDVFASVHRLLPASGPVTVRNTQHVADVPTSLFAALHGRELSALVTIARDFSPRLECHGSAPRALKNDIVLDVAGLGRLLGDPPAIGSELMRAGAPRVAIAPSQIAARLLARAQSGLTVVEADAECALADVPLAILQQLVADDHGIENGRAPANPVRHRLWPTWPACEQLFAVVKRWGLTTLGELAALPAGDLAARLGQDGLALQRVARGIDRGPLVPDPDVPRFIQSIELEWPIEALEPLSFVFARLLDPLAAALERADRGAAAIRLDLRLVDRATHTRVLQLPAPMRDPRVLRTLLLLDLESHPPSAAVDVISIEADPAPSRIVQYSLLERALSSAETLATLNARLGALVGESRCGSPVLLDTHRSDRFEMKRFTPDAASHDRALSGSRVRALGSSGARELGNRRAKDSGLELAASFTGEQPGNVASCQKPSDPPEPPSSRTPEPPIRRFRPPVAVRVTVDRGRPVRVAIDRQGMPGGRIERAAGPWRTSGAWWIAGRWNRDEWDVAFDDGTLCRLFRDRDSGVWFLDGIID